ncbi:hypothetical protein [Winogradskyella aurantia]|uniref:Uncharacterized protein n=1 Tax=Winogradskyella aurantia TaxID=1915063 RepID=A0A265US23_9FLAO|nr:hypothetical protein [Winogradskyella aurantia]OZV68104.1 hypothetical protein CA834_10685 [Winogradskyella aurantia]
MKRDKLNTVKSTGFKTPKNYFDSFDERLLEQLNKKETIEGIKTPGYQVPTDYFNSFEDKLFEKIKNDQKPVISLRSRKTFYYVAGIAASLMLALAVFLNKNNSPSLTVEMVETYLENSDLDSYELAELLSDADLLEEDFIITETDYNEGYLENYLIENVDLESILK